MMPAALPPPAPTAVLCATPHRHALGARDGRPDAIGAVASLRHPLVVRWTTPGDEAMAADTLAWAELAWDVQVDTLGFRPPLLPDGLTGDDGGGPELDIYLDLVGEFEAYAEAESYTDTTPNDGVAASPAFIVIDRRLPADWLDLYVVHEFNHVLQIATDVEESTTNVWEATATASQTWTLGEDGRWQDDAYHYQEAPWAPALTGDSYALFDDFGVGELYEYGASVWVMHLDQVIGDGDGSMGPALWEALAGDGGDEPDVVDAFAALSGEDLDVALSLLARTRWLTGDRRDARGLPGAEEWGPEAAVAIAGALDEGASNAQLEGLYVHGQAFVTVAVPDDGQAWELRLEAPRATWAIAAFGGADRPALFAHTSGAAPLSLPVPSGDLVLAITNLGPADFDGDDDPYTSTRSTVRLRPEGGGCACAASPRGRGGAAGWLLALWLLVAPWRRSR